MRLRDPPRPGSSNRETPSTRMSSRASAVETPRYRGFRERLPRSPTAAVHHRQVQVVARLLQGGEAHGHKVLPAGAGVVGDVLEKLQHRPHKDPVRPLPEGEAALQGFRKGIDKASNPLLPLHPHKEEPALSLGFRKRLIRPERPGKESEKPGSRKLFGHLPLLGKEKPGEASLLFCLPPKESEEAKSEGVEPLQARKIEEGPRKALGPGPKGPAPPGPH